MFCAVYVGNLVAALSVKHRFNRVGFDLGHAGVPQS